MYLSRSVCLCWNAFMISFLNEESTVINHFYMIGVSTNDTHKKNYIWRADNKVVHFIFSNSSVYYYPNNFQVYYDINLPV